MPKAYLIGHIELENPGGYEAYRSRTGEVIERFGGRFLVRGGALHPLERRHDVGRLVIIEFPDLHTAQAFYNSADYQALIPLRANNSSSTLSFAEGAVG